MPRPSRPCPRPDLKSSRELRVSLVGAAVIPTAPLFVPGVSMTLPDGVAEVRRAMDHALANLPHAEVMVLLATGWDDTAGAAEAWKSVGESRTYEHAEASLAGFGRPDLAARVRIGGWLSEPPHRKGMLPPALAVLALLCGDRAPVVPMSLDACASSYHLALNGSAIATSLAARCVLLAAGDLSAGLTERSPRYRIDGAVAWDKAAVAAVDAQRPERLAVLGPAEAGRVAALGWAPIVAAQAACMAAGLRLRVRHYSAPRGVGYLIATTDG